jgi:hypothetical protein
MIGLSKDSFKDAQNAHPIIFHDVPPNQINKKKWVWRESSGVFHTFYSPLVNWASPYFSGLNLAKASWPKKPAQLTHMLNSRRRCFINTSIWFHVSRNHSTSLMYDFLLLAILYQRTVTILHLHLLICIAIRYKAKGNVAFHATRLPHLAWANRVASPIFS